MQSIYKTIGKRLALSFVAFFVVTAIAVPQSYAATGATHIIRNTVSVGYNNALGLNPQTVTASVDVTVSLVAAAPTVTTTAVNATVNGGSSQTFDYTITSNANGADTFTLANAGTSLMGADLAATITLGATSVLSADPYAAGETVLNVPADGANDGTVNGIAATDIVVIGGVEYTVAAVNDANGGTANASSTITVTGDASTAVLGDTISERQTVSSTFNAQAAALGDTTATSILRVTSQTGPTNPSADSSTVTLTVTGLGVASLTVDKYSTNITTPAVGTGSSIVVDTVTYYSGGIKGAPGEKIGYLIMIQNTGTGQAQAVVVTDPIPAFTTYVTDSMKLDANVGTTTMTQKLDAVDGADEAEWDATLKEITVYAGTGGAGHATTYGAGTGGTMAAGEKSYVVFQVTID